MLACDLLPRDNLVYRTLTDLGFSFEEPEWWEDKGKLQVRGNFTCLCGNTERYAFDLDTFNWDMMNTAYGKLGVLGILERSFGYKHLIADGYSEEKAREIGDKVSIAYVTHRKISGATCID